MTRVSTSRAGTGIINPGTFNRLLVERGLTVTEFGRQSGVSRPTLSAIQRGEPLASTTIAKIAATLEGIAPLPLIADLLESA